MASNTDSTQHYYRVAYEAYAQFSNKLYKARDFEEVQQCLQNQLKYLFDFTAIRISFSYDGTWVHSSVSAQDNGLIVASNGNLLSHEEQLLENAIPMKWEGAELQVPALELNLSYEEINAVWGWYYSTGGRQVLISLATSSASKFSNVGVTIIKLLADCLESKFVELCLHEKLQQRNSSLNEAVNTIQQKNEQIKTIVKQQKDIIKEQTSELEEQNRALMEITMFNAHNLREPLSRILGLSQLAEHYEAEQLKAEIIPKIIATSSELDTTLKKIISATDLKLEKLKSQ